MSVAAFLNIIVVSFVAASVVTSAVNFLHKRLPCTSFGDMLLAHVLEGGHATDDQSDIVFDDAVRNHLLDKMM